MELSESRCRYPVFFSSSVYVQYYYFSVVRPTHSCAGFGVEALKEAIPKIARMILLSQTQNPDGQPAAPAPQTGQRTPSSLFGPAFVLHVLAENGRQMIST